MERTKKQTGRHIMMAMACALSLLSASCSSNNDEPTPILLTPMLPTKGMSLTVPESYSTAMNSATVPRTSTSQAM